MGNVTKRYFRERELRRAIIAGIGEIEATPPILFDPGKWLICEVSSSAAGIHQYKEVSEFFELDITPDFPGQNVYEQEWIYDEVDRQMDCISARIEHEQRDLLQSGYGLFFGYTEQGDYGLILYEC